MKETNLKCRQGWGGSCRTGVGWVMQVWGGWVMQTLGGMGHIRVGWSRNYRVLNLEMTQGAKLDRKIMKILSYWCYRVYQPNPNHTQGIKSEHGYKGGSVRWGHEIYRKGRMGQFYPGT